MSPNKEGTGHFELLHSYYQSKRKSFCGKLERNIRARIVQSKLLSSEAEVQDEDIHNLVGESLDVEIETLHFTPGMVTSEEVYTEISSRISHSNITQSRYTGILVDGMHNVFVQFPQIEGHPELWSALMNLTRRVGLKSVWTFTDFEVWGAQTLTTVDYESSRHKPLLTALSQSIDYGFAVVPSTQDGVDIRSKLQPDLFESREPGVFVVSTFMSHEQAAPHDFLLWDRSKEEFV